MNRQELLLVVLASARGRHFTPVQLQKSLFLLVRNLPTVVSDGPSYNFQPYDYGPFDRSVYDDVVMLERQGLASARPSGMGRWSEYSATEAGCQRGAEAMEALSVEMRSYIEQVVKWVRSQSFASLVKSIYTAYPEMKENSIFKF